MRNNQKSWWFGTLLTFGVLIGASAVAADATADNPGAQVDASGPYQLIDSAAKAMLHDLDAHRAEYRKAPAKVDHLVDQVLLPHFDTEYAARAVLGKHWPQASAEQRQRFIQAFYHSLLSNYGEALVDFTGDRLKVYPYNGAATERNAEIKTQVRKDDGSPVEVIYRVHQTEQGWKAWDVVIEGISYVRSFREDFDSEIDQKGLDEVIARLEHGDTPAAVKGTHRAQ